MDSRISADLPGWTLRHPESMRHWGSRFARLLREGDVIALVGPLGSGKTTLVQGMAAAWGVRVDVTSPTFALANEYASPRGRMVHMDFYRLRPSELEAFPLEDYFGRDVCLMEWADRIRSRWPAETLELRLSVRSAQTRRLAIRRPTAAWRRRLRPLLRA